MQIPQSPPPPSQLLRHVREKRLVGLLSQGQKPEVNGRYLHWDELRRRTPPEDLSLEEWWAAIAVARGVLKTRLPLVDTSGNAFQFARTDGVQRLLHQIDRQAGSPLETSEPQLANGQIRDRYILRSLIEEAITSSQLEGASTTRRVAKEMLLTGRKPQNQSERMIANNFEAMQLMRRRVAEPLTPAFIHELHEVVTAGTVDPEEAGRLRREDEAVTVQDRADGQILHTPPAADELPERLQRLCAFANDRSDEAFIHPVVRAISLHFMLAYDHPFVDGNGRTARALFYWSMLQQGYWLAEFLSISRVLRNAPAQYARAFLFTETDGSDLTYFVLHQLGVIQTAIIDLHAYLDRKAKEVRDTERLLRNLAPLNHRQRALLTHALRHPESRYTIQSHQRENGVVYQTARQDLLDLAEAGLLEKKQIGRAFYFDVPQDLERRLKKSPR